MTRKVQRITEVLPVSLPLFQTKKGRWLDFRKNCLQCGYLEALRRYDYEETEEGDLSWEEKGDIVTDVVRKSILKEEMNSWEAKDFRCYRGIWDATYGKNIETRTLKGLEEATKKRACRFFYPWSIGDSPKIHRELHRERTAGRRTVWATILGAVIGGTLALLGSIIVNLFLTW